MDNLGPSLASKPPPFVASLSLIAHVFYGDIIERYGLGLVVVYWLLSALLTLTIVAVLDLLCGFDGYITEAWLLIAIK